MREIAGAIDGSNFVFGAFLALSKAFDCVNLDIYILLRKLLYYGMEGKVLEWFLNILLTDTRE